MADEGFAYMVNTPTCAPTGHRSRELCANASIWASLRLSPLGERAREG